MSDRLLVATRKGLFTFRRTKAGAWRCRPPAFLGAPVSIVLADPRDGSLYAGLDHGHFGVKMHRSDDGGRSWREVAAPRYHERAPDEPEKDGMGKPWVHSTALLWSLEIDPRARGALWCGTVPGGLFHSADCGAGWQLVRGLWDRPERGDWFGGGLDLPGIHSIAVHPDDPDEVHVGVSVAGVWRTGDGGGSWELRSQGMRAAYLPAEMAREPGKQDVHRVVRCRDHPQRLWAQHHNGIFQSRNGGKKWTEVRKAGPSTFGFACAVHPAKPDTAWFVPATKDECRVPVDGRLVVTRTRDGGKTFDVLRSGLPQRHAYDLVLRHALDVDGDGRRLAFGSTTGSLFLSENGGSRWQTLSANLPPVYAVRFG